MKHATYLWLALAILSGCSSQPPIIMPKASVASPAGQPSRLLAFTVPELVMQVGDQSQPAAFLDGSDSLLNWSASPADVLSADPRTGQLKALKAGEGQLVVTSPTGQRASLKVRVRAAATATSPSPIQALPSTAPAQTLQLPGKLYFFARNQILALTPAAEPVTQTVPFKLSEAYLKQMYYFEPQHKFYLEVMNCGHNVCDRQSVHSYTPGSDKISDPLLSLTVSQQLRLLDGIDAGVYALFQERKPDGQSWNWRMKAVEGGEIINLPPDAGYTDFFTRKDPFYSRDGVLIRSDSEFITEQQLLGSSEFPLGVDGKSYIFGSSWNSAGTRLALGLSPLQFTSDESWMAAIDAKGQVLAKLKLKDVLHVDPVWSPDGRQLAAVTSNRYGNTPTLHLLDTDGGTSQSLPLISHYTAQTYLGSGMSLERSAAGSVAWSPDGQYLAYLVFGKTVRASDSVSTIEIIVCDKKGKLLRTMSVKPNGQSASLSSVSGKLFWLPDA